MSTKEAKAVSDTQKLSFEDRLLRAPAWVRVLYDIVLLLVVTVVGFGIWFAVDILFLDWDPVLRIIEAIRHVAH